jgi:hypothetical protein
MKEESIINSNLARRLMRNSHRDYWAEIKKFKRHNKNIPLVIDNAHNHPDIVHFFVSFV